jgi:hypothetical protein
MKTWIALLISLTSTTALPAASHGRLVVSANQRFLQYQDGSPLG